MCLGQLFAEQKSVAAGFVACITRVFEYGKQLVAAAGAAPRKAYPASSKELHCADSMQACQVGESPPIPSAVCLHVR
jgi:hypothetical protein